MRSTGLDEPMRLLRTVRGEPGRELFALDPAVHHLNHGSYGASLRSTLEYQAGLKVELDANPMRWFETLPPRHMQVREQLARFVGVPSETLAWVSNASAASTIVFSSIEFDEGDEVILTDHAYGAVAQGITRLVERRGVRVVCVSIPLWADEAHTTGLLLNAVSDRTRAVVLDQISSATARHFPVGEVAKTLAGAGILVVVDGAHGFGLLEQPVVPGEHVIWFGNLHKYGCAPRGAAVLSAHGAIAQQLWPSIDSWGAAQPFPERFDQQGSLDSTAFLSAAHSLASMDESFGGWQRVRAYSEQLGRYGADLLIEALIPISEDDPDVDVGMPVAQQPLVRLPRGVAQDIPGARALKEAFAASGFEVGVSTFGGRGYVRISAHAYNVANDFEALAERAPEIILDTFAMRSPTR